MSFSLLFWILMVLWVLFGFWSCWPLGAANNKSSAGNNAILLVLLFLLGWKVFGPALHP
jgi:hypothetical protein